MFGFLTITAILETLIMIPGFFMALQLVLPPTLAFMVSCLFSLVAITAIFICRLKPGPFVYKVITVVLSVIIALITAGLSLGGFIIVIISIFIFSRVRTDLKTGRDIAIQLASAAIFLNIPLAILFFNTSFKGMAFFGNMSISISTMASIIVLLMKQVDDSRRFGRNTMDISTIQRKNNQVFAGIILIVLLVAGSIGQVTTIYKFVFGLIGRFFDLIAGLLTPGKTNMPPPDRQMQDLLEKAGAQDPSLFEKIFLMVLNILAALICIAGIVFLIYNILKFIVKTIIKLIRWLTNGEHAIDMVSENGHIDEKESILNKNLKNMAHRFQNMASGIFNREVPYNRLPDDISKVRRLFKYFINNVKQSGGRVTNASTAQELCRFAGGIASDTTEFNSLLAQCYDQARYNNTAPTPEQLHSLEEKLLKK